MEEKEICDMYKNGKYIKEISKELNISWKFNYVKNNYDIDLILLKNINEIKSFKTGGK